MDDLKPIGDPPFPPVLSRTAHRLARAGSILACGAVCLTFSAPDRVRAAEIFSLRDAEALALRQGPELLMAQRERNLALLEAGRARPTFRPEVTATATQAVRTPRLDLPGKQDDVLFPNSASRLEIGVRQPLFQFGVGTAASRRARAMTDAARADYRTAQLDVILAVREAYLGAQRALSLQHVADDGWLAATEHGRVTRLLRERGLQADVDVLESDRASAEAEVALTRARHGVELSLARLNQLTGRPIESPATLEPAAELPPVPPPLATLTAGAVEHRPEISALRHQRSAGEAGLRLARAAGKPRLSLEASYALQTQTVLAAHSGVVAGLTLTVPLTSSAERSFTVREAEERLAQLRLAEAQAEQGVALEIHTQRLAMEEARRRVELGAVGIRAAEQVHAIALLKLERGQAIQAEVLGARAALQRARAEHAEAGFDLRIAAYRLQRALGLE